MSNSERSNNVLEDARNRISLIESASTGEQADELAAKARGYITALRAQNLIELHSLAMLLAEADQALRDWRTS
jgi:hypothetical protein